MISRTESQGKRPSWGELDVDQSFDVAFGSTKNNSSWQEDQDQVVGNVRDRRSSWGDVDAITADFTAESVEPASRKVGQQSIKEVDEEQEKKSRRANRRKKKTPSGLEESETSTETSTEGRRKLFSKKISKRRLSIGKSIC